MENNLISYASKYIKGMAFFLLLVFVTPPALSQDKLYITRDESLGLLYNIGIDQYDGITGNCWTTPEATVNRVTAKLEQAGIHTYKERLALTNGVTANLIINTNGFRTGSGLCVGTANLSVISNVYSTFGGAVTGGTEWSVTHVSLMFERETLFSGAENLNEEILSQVDSFIDELIGMVYKGRRQDAVSSLIEKMPSLRSEPMTQKEFNEMLRKAMESDS